MAHFKQKKVRQPHYFMHWNGLKYFVLQFNDCMMETVGWGRVHEPITATWVGEVKIRYK